MYAGSSSQTCAWDTELAGPRGFARTGTATAVKSRLPKPAKAERRPRGCLLISSPEREHREETEPFWDGSCCRGYSQRCKDFAARARGFLVFLLKAFLSDISLNAGIVKGMSSFDPFVLSNFPLEQSTYFFLSPLSVFHSARLVRKFIRVRNTRWICWVPSPFPLWRIPQRSLPM